eukprot:TRINITY_DN22952_c0_g1_i1.p1 TRINITY_DN22952_c0_g1~~TRINITY_DN22952_c0_g1_i1.p1  ORF type:complete len:1327 (+),score=589.50 TRINITY_DN22952_c0_g1_i1:84-4064(+)
MSAIEQLAITGIRSFNPDPAERQLLVFGKPVTIILGPNGAGKTTIIETIRNACTGDLPTGGAGRGNAFVHDPKVAGETEVKAQIRMQFRGANKQQYLITRSFQLTQKDQVSQKFETLDATLQSRDPRTHQVVSQSYKCADMDVLVPTLIGISKPILDNVIFLHQDDVNWPLAEPSTLKKKFDAIFSSARYTKALDEVRRMIKETREGVKEHQANLAVYREQRMTAHQLRSQCEADEKKMALIREKQAEVNRRCAEVQAAIADAERQADATRELEKRQQAVRGNIETLVLERDRLQAALPADGKVNDTDAELKECLARFTDVIREVRRRQDEAARALQELREQGQEEARRLSGLRSERDFLGLQGEEHQRRVTQLQGIVREASERYDLRLPGHISGATLDEPAILRFHAAFRERVEQLQAQRDTIRAEARKAQEVAERDVGGARQQREQLLAARMQAQKSMDELKPRIRALKAQYTDMESAQGEHEAARGRLQEADHRLGAQQGVMEELQGRVRRHHERHEALRARAQGLQAEAASRRDEQEAAHRLKLLREEQERHRREAADTRARVEARYAQLVGRKLSPATLHEDVTAAAQSKQSAVDRAQQQVMAADRQAALLRQQQELLGEQMDKLRHDIQVSETKYRFLEEEHGKPLPEILAAAQASEAKYKRSVDTIGALDKCHSTFVQQAEESSACPLCTRGLSEPEMGVLKRHVKETTKDVPATLAQRGEQLRKAQRLVATVQGLLPLHREVERVRGEELPRLQQQRSAAKDKGDSQQEILRDLTAKLESLRFEERECRDLVAAADKIRECNRALTAASARISAEESKLAQARGRDVRTLDLVQADLEAVQREMDAVSGEQQAALREMEDAGRARAALGEAVQAARRACDEKLLRVEERARVRKEYDAVTEAYRRHQNEVQDAQGQLPAVDERIQRVSAELEAQRAAGDRKEREATQLAERHHHELSRISNYVDDIRRHIDERRSERLDRAQQELVRLERQAREREERAAAAQAELESHQRTANEHGMMKHSIEANIAFREKRAEAAAKEAELRQITEELQRRTKGHGGTLERLQTLREQKGQLEREAAQYTGQLQATDGMIRERQRELALPKFDKIDERFASTLIRQCTSQIAEEDLAKYASALDRALMQYHDQKINEINEIIKDLWVRTYRGQDIDHIELRSDVEQEGSAAKKRSYNYRVVMVKGGTGLDMRGRCSAGQKVLASLVVRIALSQAFCCDCGILALDEPTTNLDSENIFSLGQALIELIQHASSTDGPTNFQLIIITHDEGFVRQIVRSTGTEHVFHVTKDGEGQYSRIQQRSMADFV